MFISSVVMEVIIRGLKEEQSAARVPQLKVRLDKQEAARGPSSNRPLLVAATGVKVSVDLLFYPY